MADFIAVIRRAVDGLSENTPEMRAKVYERAKSAVVRQLENMKPRPPEVMFQKQLDKLDAAIREVEAEHTEALPSDEMPAAAVAEEPPAAEPVVAASEPVAAVAPPPPVPEPVKAAPVEPPAVIHRELIPESILRPAEQLRREQPYAAPVIAEPVQELPAETSVEVVTPTQPVHPAEEPEAVVPAHVTNEAPVDEPAARLEPETHPAQLDVQPHEVVAEIAPHHEIVPVQTAAEILAGPADAMIFHKTALPVEPEVEPTPEIRVAPQPPVAVEQPVVSQPVAVHADGTRREVTADTGARSDAVEAEQAQGETPPMPKVSYDESDVVAGFNDFLKEELNRKVVPPPPVRKPEKQDDFSWDAPFDDLPEIEKPETFEKALEAKQKEISVGAEKRKGKPLRNEPVSARAELEDLLGIEPDQRRGPQPVTDGEGLPQDVSRAMSKLEGKSFKMQKNKKAKRKFRLMPIAAGLAGLLVLAGGAFALWHYRQDVSQLVAGMMPSQDAKKPTDTKDVKSDATQPDAKTDTAQMKQPSKETEVASLNSDVGPQKFTQRLLPDGSETDTDTAKVPVDQALKEGKTISGQTEKGKEVAATTTTDTKSETTDATQPQNDAQPLGATQKMFLYEERLGQSSPVAVPGTVVWREKADTEDGKPNPTIEASLEIPDRKITALISIKRNSDPSLPASHIIEIVFALPKNFEEGNVESIQRIAFKQTEQDRGNPLIAVPARITDDFHMVALNDDADARKVNLELMKTRSWIDIPITYRNGRRALITLEKGATGTAVFDKVMAEWDALGAQTNNNQ